ncbi:hypothetical protein [Dialister invisus]|jgi:hypothetical protein|uniref:hypothetical protein n=1 Tax=Dialister invisus TaxID=218538 RepID=UPI000EDBE1D8|nr:hypothetical protein [Dialister invisus]HCK78296.1 hypothetical protein [Dialister sp.]
MKITGLSFFGGIVFTVLIFAFMCCAIGEDFIRHKDRRHPSLYKYVIFIFMGILLTVFSFLFVVLTETNVLEILLNIDMSHSSLISLIGSIFVCIAAFILVRYFACILTPEFTKKSESEIAQAQKQTILLSILNVFIELFVIGYYRDVLWYVISWIFY